MKAQSFPYNNDTQLNLNSISTKLQINLNSTSIQPHHQINSSLDQPQPQSQPQFNLYLNPIPRGLKYNLFHARGAYMPPVGSWRRKKNCGVKCEEKIRPFQNASSKVGKFFLVKTKLTTPKC